jgi:opacity protein-like surface antigen
MRHFLFSVAALTVIIGLPALAADYPVLRGTSSPSLPPAPVLHDAPAPFDGFYIGGLAGHGAINFDPRNGAADLVARALRNTTVEEVHNASRLLQPSQFSARNIMFGGFAGYNLQSDEAVVGIEFDYMRFGKSGSSIDTIARQFPNTNNFIESVTLSGGNETKLEHLFGLRARAGYAIGNVMPYLTGGLAVGYGRVSNFANARAQGRAPDPTQPPGSLPYDVTYPPMVATTRNAAMIGFTGGAGLEAVYGGLILRGEYLFSRLQSQGGVTLDVNQARVGAGVKF